MSGVHGKISFNAKPRSASVAAMIGASVPAPTQQLVVGPMVAGSMLVALRGKLATRRAPELTQSRFGMPRGVILLIGRLIGLLIGLLIATVMLAEGVMYNWSVLYVQQELGAI